MADDRTPIEPAPERKPIDDAIDRVEQRKHNRISARLPLMAEPHQWPLTADVTIVGPEDSNDPVLLIWEPTELAWRVILVPPGSEWQIRRKGTDLWAPGRQQ